MDEEAAVTTAQQLSQRLAHTPTPVCPKKAQKMVVRSVAEGGVECNQAECGKSKLPFLYRRLIRRKQ